MRRGFVIMLVAVVTGSLYGYVSALGNQPPAYKLQPGETLSAAQRVSAWQWMPSPTLLPSYVLCRLPPNGFGISHTRSGYVFRSEYRRLLYFSAAVAMGAGFGVISGLLCLWMMKRPATRPSGLPAADATVSRSP